jgi:hypothetical protein
MGAGVVLAGGAGVALAMRLSAEWVFVGDGSSGRGTDVVLAM